MEITNTLKLGIKGIIFKGDVEVYIDQIDSKIYNPQWDMT
jgi:hypothetical protein